MNINLWQALELKPYNTAQTVYAEIGKILVDYMADSSKVKTVKRVGWSAIVNVAQFDE